jgi:hypothetical protein
MLVGTGLRSYAGDSFVHLANTDPGFNVAGTVIARVRQPPGQGQGEAAWAWRDRIVELIKQVPGTTGVTSIGTLPLILPDGVDPWNIGMFATVTLVLLSVGAGAAWIPAREAANVDPSFALRQE